MLRLATAHALPIALLLLLACAVTHTHAHEELEHMSKQCAAHRGEHKPMEGFSLLDLQQEHMDTALTLADAPNGDLYWPKVPVADFPCSNCLADGGQLPGAVYRVQGKCYRAQTRCKATECLADPASKPKDLLPVDCSNRYVERRAVCTSWGDPHYVTFDGNRYNMYDEGEYMLFYDPDTEQRVNTVTLKPVGKRASWPSYNTGMAFRARDRAGRYHTVVVQITKPQDRELRTTAWINGEEVTNLKHNQEYWAGKTMVLRYGHGRQIYIVNKHTRTEVTASIHTHAGMWHMNVRVYVPGYFAQRPMTTGMCGSYDQSRGNDYTLPSGTTPAGGALGFARTFRVTQSNTLFVMQTHFKQLDTNITPLMLAQGNRALVHKAEELCKDMPELVRDGCVLDTIATGDDMRGEALENFNALNNPDTENPCTTAVHKFGSTVQEEVKDCVTKATGQGVSEFHTPDRASYTYMKSASTEQVVIKARASSMKIALSPEPRDRTSMLELVFGGGNNNDLFAIRTTANGANKAEARRTGLMHKNEYRTFSIRTKGGVAQVDYFDSKEQKWVKIVSHADTHLRAWSFVGFQTSGGVTGSFKVRGLSMLQPQQCFDRVSKLLPYWKNGVQRGCGWKVVKPPEGGVQVLPRAARIEKDFVQRSATCFSWGDPHYGTFDGLRYDFYGDGEYVYHDNPAVGERMTTLTGYPKHTKRVSVNTGFGWSGGGTTVTVQMLQPQQHFRPTLAINGEHFDLRDSANRKTFTAGPFSIKVHSQRHIVIVSGKSGEVASLHLGAWSMTAYMNVRVTSPGYFRAKQDSDAKYLLTTGMCGSFDGDRSNDRMLPDGSIAGNNQAWIAGLKIASKDDSLMIEHPDFGKVEVSRGLTLLEAANGNQKLVLAAQAACAKVPSAEFPGCCLDYIVEGKNERVPEEAEANAAAADAKPAGEHCVKAFDTFYGWLEQGVPQAADGKHKAFSSDLDKHYHRAQGECFYKLSRSEAEQHIREAFKKLLLKEPTDEQLAHYTHLVRSGRITKDELHRRVDQSDHWKILNGVRMPGGGFLKGDAKEHLHLHNFHFGMHSDRETCFHRCKSANACKQAVYWKSGKKCYLYSMTRRYEEYASQPGVKNANFDSLVRVLAADTHYADAEYQSEQCKALARLLYHKKKAAEADRQYQQVTVLVDELKAVLDKASAEHAQATQTKAGTEAAVKALQDAATTAAAARDKAQAAQEEARTALTTSTDAHGAAEKAALEAQTHETAQKNALHGAEQLFQAGTARVNSLSKHLKQGQQSVADTTATKQTEEETLQKLVAKLQEAHQNHTVASKVAAEKEQAKDSAQQDYNNAVQTQSRLQQEKEAAETKLEEAKNTLQEAKVEEKTVAAKLEQVTTDSQSADTAQSGAEEAAKVAAQNLQEAEEAFENTKAPLAKATAREAQAVQTKTDMDQALVEATQKRDNLSNEVEKLETALEEAKGKSRATSVALETASKKLSEASDGKKRSEAELVTAITRRDELQGQRDDAKKAMDKAQALAQKLAAARAAAKQTEESRVKEFNNLEVELAKQTSTVKTLSEQLEAAKKAAQSAKTKCDQAQAEFDAAVAKEGDLAKKLAVATTEKQQAEKTEAELKKKASYHTTEYQKRMEGGSMMQALTTAAQDRVCKRGISAADPNGPSVCCGSSPASAWKNYHGNMMVDIDTKHCQFEGTPAYFSTTSGRSNHWTTTGHNQQYNPTATGFRVYITAKFQKRLQHDYELHWCGFGKRSDTRNVANKVSKNVGVCCGMSDDTWSRYHSHMYRDMSLKKCGFKSAPMLITSLNGAGGHRALKGVGATYRLSASSFRNYVWGSSPAAAKKLHYKFKWCAVGEMHDRKDSCGGVRVLDERGGRLANQARVCCGVSDSQWQAVRGGLRKAVDTRSCALQGYSVRYFTSIRGRSWHWSLHGGSSVYNPTEKSFVINVQGNHGWVPTPQLAIAGKWQVQWCAVAWKK